MNLPFPVPSGKYRVSSKRPGPRLKKLVKLSERKKALLAELQNIDREMIRLEKERQARRPKNTEAKLTVSTDIKKSRRRRSS